MRKTYPDGHQLHCKILLIFYRPAIRQRSQYGLSYRRLCEWQPLASHCPSMKRPANWIEIQREYLGRFGVRPLWIFD